MSLVKLDNVVKTYQMGDSECQALKGVSFSIEKGEFTAIMGSSGSGKTTIMNTIGLLDQPTSGCYLLNGQNVMDFSVDQLAEYRNRLIGFVFQSFLLLPKLTALQNVGLPLLYRSVAKTEIRKRSLSMLERVGMADYVNHRPYELSGGQQQRVAIARALVGEPQLILADEPTGALDSNTSDVVMGLLHEMHQQKNVTVIVITHDHGVAAQCHRVIKVQDGLVVNAGRQSSKETSKVGC
jgi:putative ABC transport system ATP-binding protein